MHIPPPPLLLRRIALVLTLVARSVLAQLPVRVVSFNIRYDNTDLSFGDAERYWFPITCGDDSPCRLMAVGSVLLQAVTTAPAGAPVSVGLQECLDNQLRDVIQVLGQGADPSWTYAGVARNDGDRGGEYAAVLYRADALDLVFTETKWLSPTPDVPSAGWGARENRIVTLVVFQERVTRRRYIHANTHLDNASPEARVHGVAVVLDRIAKALAQFGPMPVFLTGDFNSAEGGGAYKAVAADGTLQDLYGLLRGDQRAGPYETFTGFAGQYRSRMDYIWVGPRGKSPYRADRYEVLSNVAFNIRGSDHQPVVGDVTIG